MREGSDHLGCVKKCCAKDRCARLIRGRIGVIGGSRFSPVQNTRRRLNASLSLSLLAHIEHAR